MTAAPRITPISVDEYLAGELASPFKHEYVGGFVYAMAGARNAHNIIATNLLGLLHARLADQVWRPFNSDTKIRVRLPQQTRFYYPDLSVVCRPNPQEDSFQDEPVIVFEVLSEATRRIDEGEKKDAYLTIPSLQTLVLVEQDAPALSVFRRTDEGFRRETLHGLEARLDLPEIGVELPLALIYQTIRFEFSPSEPEE